MDNDTRGALQELLNRHSSRLFSEALAATGDRQQARALTIAAFRTAYARMAADPATDGDAAVNEAFALILPKTAPESEPIDTRSAAAAYEPPTALEPEPVYERSVAIEPEYVSGAPYSAAPTAYEPPKAYEPAAPTAVHIPVAADDAVLTEDEDDDEPVIPHRTNPVAAAAVVVLAAALVWVMIGVMGGYGIIPKINLGYDAIGFYTLPIF